MHTTAQQILDEALLELPGCPRPLAAAALRDVVREFLERSQVLTVALDAITVVAGTHLYELELPSGQDGFRVHRPVLVVLNGVEQRAGIDWRMQDRTTLQLRDVPGSDIDEGLEVTVAVALDDVQTASLEAIEDWWPAIGAGVKARLMLMPGKPWTDPAGGAVYRRDWHDGLGRAMAHAASDGLGVPQRLRM